VIGARRRRNASQRCSERHRRYQGEKGLQVHMDAPCSRRNLRGCGRETRHRLSGLADAHVTSQRQRREDVGLWHFSDMAFVLDDVR